MKIAINALSVSSGGGLTAMLSLVPALQQAGRDIELVVIASATQKSLVARLGPGVRVHTVGFDPRALALRVLYEQLVLPLRLAWMSVDWLYAVGNTATVLAPCRVLLLIENANPFSSVPLDRAWKERLRLRALRALGWLSAKRATRVRFLSENSREIVGRMLGLRHGTTVVIPHGATLPAAAEGQTRESLGLPARFVLTVCDIYPYKNLHTLVDAFEILVVEHRYPGSLVIAGAPKSARYMERLRAQVRAAGLEDRVEFRGWIEPERLPEVFRAADVFVFPSVEETFGMPVVEAMQYGAPVIVPASRDRGLFVPYQELCAEAAMYFDPDDSKGLAATMRRVLEDGRLRSQLRQAGRERVKAFRWEETAAALLDVFREASSVSFEGPRAARLRGGG